MDEDLARTALDLLRNDSAATVRAEAATALGAYLAVREEGDPEAEALARRIENALLQSLNTDEEDVLVRQRSLEAYAYADDPYVDDVLEEAYDSDEDEMRASAVFAMGRRGDEDWLPVIHRELRSDAEAMRFAAVCAVTDIGSAGSVPFLLQVIGEDPNDGVRIAAVFALAEIDAPEAGRILEELLESDDVAISAAADEALEIRGTFESPGKMLLLDYGLPDAEGLSEDGASNNSRL
jgi:HEAT repeat protein